MRIPHFALTLAALVLHNAAAVAQTRPHLCAAGEEVAFSCATGKAKIVSLCAAPAKNGSVGLRYLFGTRAKIELNYPAPGTPAAFARGVTGGTGGGADILRFANGGADYTLFSDHYRGRERDGLVIARDGKRIAVLICRDNAVAPDKGWGTIYRANLPTLPPDFDPP